MKKILFFGLVLCTITSCAQDKSYKEKESERKKDKKVEASVDDFYNSDYEYDYDISSDKKNQIIALKKKASIEFQKIGRDRSLSGYEKGRRKREVSYKLRRDIDEIVGRSGNYYNENNDYGNYNSYRKSYRDEIDDQIDDLEDQYEVDIKEIEKKYNYNKDLMKREKEKRKAEYKKEKNRLKDLKRN